LFMVLVCTTAVHKSSFYCHYFGVYSLHISLLRTPSTPTQKPENRVTFV
jgi:hypothetical protein